MSAIRRLAVAVIGTLALLVAPMAWAQVPDSATRLPVDPAVNVGRLPNGLSWYVRRNTRPAGRAELRLVVNAGSVLETEAQRGLAHFVEHMAFNGTERFRKMEIVDYLESIGMRFGPEINAYTSFDETVYMLELPTDDPAVLEKGLEILYEWSSRLTLDPEEIRKERGVIVEEWRLGRGAQGRITDAQIPVLLSGSRYAERLPIGLRSVIEGAPASEIVGFYRDWYRPDLMAVVAVGDFDAATVTALVQRIFGRIPARAPSWPRVLYPVPDHAQTLYSVVADPETTYSAVTLDVLRPVEPFVTVGDYRKRIVDSLVTMMLSRRLEERTQSTQPPYIQAWAAGDRLVRTKEVFSLGALVEAGGVERGLEAVLTEAERARVHGFTFGELERASSDLLASLERAWRERDTSPSRPLAEEYIRAYLEQEPIPGIAYEYDLHKRLLPTIGLDEVNAAAARLVRSENRVVLVEGPQKPGQSLPSESALAAVFDRVQAASVEPYVDTAQDRPLVETRPRPGAVVEERRLDAIDAVQWTLSNGARVIVKPTDFRADQIVFQAFSPGGTSLVSDRDYIPAITATSVVQEAGLGAFSAVDLQKTLAGTNVQLSPWIDETAEGMSGSASPGDLETMLQLVYLNFTQPRRDEVSFQSLKTRLQAYVANRAASPEAAFSDTVTAIMTRDDPRSRSLTPELLEQMNLDASLRVYRERFTSPGDFTFVFVGAVAPAALRPLAETWIGGIPSSAVRETWKDLGVDPPTQTVTRDVRRGLEPKSRVALRFAGDFVWSRDEVIRLTAVADILEIRLREKLREEMSGTYGAGVRASAQRSPDGEYSIAIDFGCDPARVDELVEAVFREIDWIRNGPVDEIYLTKEKEALRRTREEALRENRFWTQSIQASLLYGDDPAEVLTFYDRVAAINAAVVQGAARRYLTPDRYVRVVLYPQGPSG